MLTAVEPLFVTEAVLEIISQLTGIWTKIITELKSKVRNFIGIKLEKLFFLLLKYHCLEQLLSHYS